MKGYSLDQSLTGVRLVPMGEFWLARQLGSQLAAVVVDSAELTPITTVPTSNANRQAKMPIRLVDCIKYTKNANLTQSDQLLNCVMPEAVTST